MKNESFTKHFVYWILPLLLILPCILLYFPDPYGTGKYIAPDINREFGIIENLQLIFIVFIFFTALSGVRGNTGIEKYVWTLVTVLTVFIFLEEIDYGLHYYEYLIGKSRDQVAYEFMVEGKIRNLHNIGKATSVMKFMVYMLMLILFAVMPLLPVKLKHRYSWLDYFAPSKFILTTGITLLALNAITTYLNNQYSMQGTPLYGNLSEFEETMTYYLFLMYCREMVRKRWQVPASKWNVSIRHIPRPAAPVNREKARSVR